MTDRERLAEVVGQATKDQATIWAATVYLPSMERQLARMALSRISDAIDKLIVLADSGLSPGEGG